MRVGHDLGRVAALGEGPRRGDREDGERDRAVQMLVVREREGHEEGEGDAERLREGGVARDELGALLGARRHVEQGEEEDEREEHGVEGRVDVRGERGGAVDLARV